VLFLGKKKKKGLRNCIGNFGRYHNYCYDDECEYSILCQEVTADRESSNQ
jgi:hypothetical protein